MIERATAFVAVTVAVGFVGAAQAQDPGSARSAANVTPSQVAAFVGTWLVNMTNPAGAQETVRVWEENGTVKASVRAGRFPPLDATGIMKDGEMLVLTAHRFENGKPIWAVIALTLDSGTLKLAQMLEHSETIKRGSGTRAAP